jgi:hypothetical protein
MVRRGLREGESDPAEPLPGEETKQQEQGADMTDDTISAHVVAAMLGLDAAEKAAACRAGWDSVEEWSLAWGGVVTAQIALSAAAGPHLEAQAASLEPLAAGDCAEYLRACVWALDTIGPQADMPGLTVARAYVEDVAREVAAIGARELVPPESGGWSRLNVALLTRARRNWIGSPQPVTPAHARIHSNGS